MDFGLKQLYINGELQEAHLGKVKDIICPGNEEVIAQCAWGSGEDATKALNAAKDGFEYWSRLDLKTRIKWIYKLRDALIQNEELLRNAIMHEMGKVWAGTEEDFTSITNSLAFYSEEITQRKPISIKDKEGTHTHSIVSQPLGVVVAFLAYNFPLLNLGFKLGPALAAGCSIVIKPSEYSPLSAYVLGEICASIDFPNGVINIICGDAKEVGIPLSESSIPRLITMIGSTNTAQNLIAQSCKTSLKRYSMECGGNAPFIVFPDADLEQAINIGAALKIGNSGQICVAPNRFYIHESIVDQYIAGLKVKFENVKVGFGRENQVDMGPLANEISVSKLIKIVDEAKQQGGQLISGGSALDRSGYYFAPTIIKFENQNADILNQEVFGPIAFITTFKTKEEVIELANNTEGGLASYVFSSDQNTIDYFIEKLEFGEIQINGVKYDIYLPHGGIKNSGIGVDCSTYALDDYLIRKRVSAAIV